MSINPLRLRFDLQASRFILLQNRQQPVIGVLSHAPSSRGALRGIVEYPEEDQRIASVTFGEIGFVEAEAHRDTAHQRVAKLGHSSHVFQYGLAKSRNV